MKGTRTLFVILITVFVILGYWSMYQKGRNDVISHLETDTLREVYIDTIPYYMPVAKDSLVIRYDTVRLPVAVDTNKSELKNDSIEQDSTKVILPIQTKVYNDSNYTAYVSGYRLSLDSLILHQKRETAIIVKRTKPKRWGIGIHAGYGISLQKEPSFVPYIGIGISYNFFAF